MNKVYNMRLIYFGFLLVVIVITGFFVWADLDYAKEVTIVNEPTAASITSPAPQFIILEKIQEGIELLRKSPLLDYETKYYTVKKGIKIKTGDLVRKQIALAILNKNTGEVFEQRVWVKEQDIKNYKKTGVLEFTPAIPDETLDIQPQWWNSFNTDYAIPDRPELIVVANKYLFPNKYLSGLPEKSNDQYTDIIYVPYSKNLHLPEVIKAGKLYLEKNIEQTFIELETAKVRSRLAPGSLITENISKDFIRNIIIVEHVDPDGFRNATDSGQELSERVLAIIGANQSSAYRYTGSPAGASGLAQFIKSTYKNVVAKYPEAGLIKDYNAGMADHVNAIKAMVLFFDAHKKEITDKINKHEIVKSLGITEEMLAATYNGGPGKVVRSVNKFGLAWISNQLNIPRVGRIFRQETINYIKKFQAIKNLNLFANTSVN